MKQIQIRKNISRKQRKGVTLIELIIVLAISAFMITIALNGITNRGRSSFDDGMKQVFNDLRSIQNEAAAGQGPVESNSFTCTSGSEKCLLAGQELVGKGVTLSTDPVSTINDNTILDTPNFSQEFKVSGGLARGYVEYSVVRAAQLTTTVHARSRKNKTLPGSVALKEITTQVGVSLPVTTNKQMIIFARGVSIGDNSSVGGNALPPHVFTQSHFSDGAPTAGGCCTNAQTFANYAVSQNIIVTLQFVNPENTSMKASIVIDSAAGTMELKQ